MILSLFVFASMALTSPVTADMMTRPYMGSSLVSKSISARGGAGPIAPKDMAKFSTAVLGLQGGLGILSPMKAMEGYGWNSTSMAEWVSRRWSTNILSNVLITWCSIFQEDMQISKAIGLGFIPWIIDFIWTLGNDDAKKLDFDERFVPLNVLSLAMACLGTFAGLTDASYTDAVFKATAAWMGLNGLALCFATEPSKKMWGLPACDVTVDTCLSFHGASVVSGGIIVWALNSGMDPLRALGIAWIPPLVRTIKFLVLDDVIAKHGLPKAPYYGWLLLMLTVVGTLVA